MLFGGNQNTVSSEIILQKSEPQTTKAIAKSFLLGVAKAAGGTVLGITMITSAVAAGGLVGLAFSFRNLPDITSFCGNIVTQNSHVR